MKSATFLVEFSFNNIMYKKTDGVAMGSPLGPALTNLFVRYYKKSYFLKHESLQYTSDYVDDTFSIFDHEAKADQFLTKLNCLYHPSNLLLKKRNTNVYRFLIFMSKNNVGFETSVYRNPTFTGEYLRCKSFSPLKCKISLISTWKKKSQQPWKAAMIPSAPA